MLWVLRDRVVECDGIRYRDALYVSVIEVDGAYWVESKEDRYGRSEVNYYAKKDGYVRALCSNLQSSEGMIEGDAIAFAIEFFGIKSQGGGQYAHRKPSYEAVGLYV